MQKEQTIDKQKITDNQENPAPLGRVERLVSTFDGLPESESITHQLALWVAGKPVHNPIRDECCPDFSCCNGGKIASVEVRKRFAKAVAENDEYAQMEMLGMFLGQAFSDENIYVAGTSIPFEC